MQIAWTNRGDSATLTASSELSTSPGSNVQQVHVARPWGTAAGVKSAYLIFDLGSALACDLLALLGTNLTSSATIQVRASTVDPTVTSSLLLDTGAIATGVKAGYGAIYKSLGSVTARYWRIDLADATLPDNIQVGRVFLGPSWTPTVPLLYGWRIGPEDQSKVEKSYGGQAYSDRRPKQRVISFTLDLMPESEMFGNAFALDVSNGIVDDILVIPVSISSSYLSEQAVFGQVRGPIDRIVNANPVRFGKQYTVEERL